MMLEGKVKWFNEDKGYGFIQPNDGGGDVFVHVSDVRDSGYRKLLDNEQVEFEVEEDNRGRLRARNITAFEIV